MLLFYREPVALNREAHKDLRFTAKPDFSFSTGVNSVPLAGIEFFEAGRDVPVFFSRDKDGNFFPLALLALESDGHRWVADDGRWQGQYVPAFIRRYPFALTGDGTVCFDQQAPSFTPDGQPLFKEDGANAPVLDSIIQYLNLFEAEYGRTREFCAALKEQDLFKAFALQIMAQGKPAQRFDGLYILDEQKVATLADATVTEWFRKGWLGWLFAHLHSLANLERLNRQLNENGK
jgi:hypothetical protein